MSKSSVSYIGMDVDKAKIVVAVLKDSELETTLERMIVNSPHAVQQFVEAQQSESEEIMACYEAGSCGFELYRQLTELGVTCLVAAPGLIPHAPGKRVKTDRLDARKLARALRSGELTGVHVPCREDEHVRDYLRLYEDLKRDLRRAKQRLLQFLLRQRIRYTEGTNWTCRHRRWLEQLQFASPVSAETMQEHLWQIAELEEKLGRMKRQVEAIAADQRYAERVSRLKAFKGIETLIALSLIVEIADFNRFARAEQFMAFLGLVPSEHSSGAKRRLGGITKAGNTHLRKLLIEAAWQYRRPNRPSKRLTARRAQLPASLVAYADRAARRLHTKYLRLIYAGKCSQVAATATARELSGFLWGAMVAQIAS